MTAENNNSPQPLTEQDTLTEDLIRAADDGLFLGLLRNELVGI